MRDGSVEAPVYPSIFLRGAAFLIDWAIVLLLAVFVAGSAEADQATRFVILLVMLSVYHIGFGIGLAATPGKMAMRMHITDPKGARLTPDKVILRFLVFLVSVLLVVAFVVNALLLVSDGQRRALHDRVAGTRVRYGRPSWVQDGNPRF